MPVLLAEAMDLMAVKTGGVYVDGTVGGGGHARAVLDRSGQDGFLLGLDRDEDALGRCRRALEGSKGRWVLQQGRFSDLDKHARAAGATSADGVLLDVGVSSEQLDTPCRGFSFLRDGPLDMRMDRSGERTAADVVNSLSEEELARVIREYGEEPRARRVAAAIVRARRHGAILTTGALASVVSAGIGYRHGRLHPATRTFQALRILVNGELDELALGLDASLSLLRDGGRLVVITFHSLEDRMVKRFMAAHAGRWESQPQGGAAWRGERPAGRLLTRKPVRPGEEECRRNPRARSAKLRAMERIGQQADGTPSDGGEQ